MIVTVLLCDVASPLVSIVVPEPSSAQLTPLPNSPLALPILSTEVLRLSGRPAQTPSLSYSYQWSITGPSSLTSSISSSLLTNPDLTLNIAGETNYFVPGSLLAVSLTVTDSSTLLSSSASWQFAIVMAPQFGLFRSSVNISAPLAQVDLRAGGFESAFDSIDSTTGLAVPLTLTYRFCYYDNSGNEVGLGQLAQSPDAYFSFDSLPLGNPVTNLLVVGVRVFDIYGSSGVSEYVVTVVNPSSSSSDYWHNSS